MQLVTDYKAAVGQGLLLPICDSCANNLSTHNSSNNREILADEVSHIIHVVIRK